MARDKRDEIAERAADIALAAMPVPLRVLDVGCGAGHLLAELVVRAPYCEVYVGVDSPSAVSVARQASDTRVTFVCADPAALPFPPEAFDLVTVGDSFDSWPDQQRGVAELARILRPTGTVVIVDQPRRASGGPERAHSAKAVSALLDPVGLRLKSRELLLRSAFAQASAQAYIATRRP